MDNHTGIIGESFATELMIQNGYNIIERNYHSRYGEIDIIATDKDHIIFLEVKTRDKNCLSSPLSAVTVTKQKKIIKTAEFYLMNHSCNLQPRFDVIGIITDNKGKTILSYDYIKSAFYISR